MRRFTGYKRSLAALVVAMLSMAMGVGFIVPLLPVYAEEMGASGAWIGFILATGPHHLFILRTLQGICSAMIGPVARAYAGEISPSHKEGEVMGTLNMGFFAGFSAGPLVGGLTADRFGFNVPFVVMALFSAASYLLIRAYLPEQTVSGARAPGFSSEIMLESLRLYRHRLVTGAVLLRGSVGIGHGIFSTLMPLVGQLVLGLSSSQVGFVITARSVTAAALQPQGGKLADNFNRRWVALITSLMIPIGFLAIPYVAHFAHLVAAGILIGVGFGTSVPSAEAMAVERGREYGMGRIMGLNEMTRSLTMAVGSIIGGVAMDILGPVNAHVLAAGLSVFGLGVAMWLLRGYRPSNLQPARRC